MEKVYIYALIKMEKVETHLLKCKKSKCIF